MMLQLPRIVALRSLIDSADCEAQIVPVDRALAKQIDAGWWQIGGSKTARRAEGDHSWSWTQIFGKSRGDASREMVALVTADGVAQGAMVYWVDGKSLLEEGVGSVFVEYIATAPRNRPWLVEKPCFQGVGTELLLYAICHSYLLGFGGRTTLVSLPTEGTRQFYANRGFTKVSEDKDGYAEFELTPQAAERWLQERGLLE